MAPATLSVHRVLAIKSKTHFAKDVFDRYGLAPLTWQGLANLLMPVRSPGFRFACFFPAGSARFPPGRPALCPCPSTCYRVMPVSYDCNRIDLKINRFKGLVLLR